MRQRSEFGERELNAAQPRWASPTFEPVDSVHSDQNNHTKNVNSTGEGFVFSLSGRIHLCGYHYVLFETKCSWTVQLKIYFSCRLIILENASQIKGVVHPKLNAWLITYLPSCSKRDFSLSSTECCFQYIEWMGTGTVKLWKDKSSSDDRFMNKSFLFDFFQWISWFSSQKQWMINSWFRLIWFSSLSDSTDLWANRWAWIYEVDDQFTDQVCQRNRRTFTNQRLLLLL